MVISLSTMAGGSNDFNINVTGPYTSVTLSKTMPAGSYSISSAAVDTTIDIYAYNSDGSSAGYTSNKAFTASTTFNKLVILGGSTGDVLSFTFKTTYPSVNATAEVTAGPVITSVVTASLPNINDTTTVTGRNFATDIEATLTGSDNVARAPKSLVRGSATSLVITRPDDFPTAYSPYTLTLSNPGVSNPIGTNSHISSNVITSGSTPSWVTSSSLTQYKISTSYSQTIQATDSDGGSSITYSVVSGSLPTGISFNTSTATYSGTSSVSSGTFTHTVRATDSGGNYVDRAFTIAPQTVPDAPTIGAATATATGTASIAFTAPSYVGASSITGYTITSSGGQTGTGTSSPITVSGMTAGTSYTFTIVATNSSGSSAASSASSSFTAKTMNVVTLTSNTTWTVPSSVTTFDAVAIGGGGGASYGYGGGGGSGGGAYKTFTTTPGSTFAVTIGGAGANAQPSQNTPGNSGSNTSFGSITGYGGGGCRDYGSSSPGLSGGSGGGGASGTVGGSATKGTGGDIHYGNIGGDGGGYPPASVNNSGCGAGGGLGSAGVKGRGGAGLQFFGQSTWRGLGGRGHGYNTDPGWSNDGADGVQPANSGNGANSDAAVGTTAASGVVILRYFS